MTRLIHLSDLHFGTENVMTLEPLVKIINDLQPKIVIITGDFTQRAKISQFKKAQSFIQNIDCTEILCVPGNHDIPLHNIFFRMLFPLTNYKKYIAGNLNPTYRNDQLLMMGINSTTPFRVMDGHVSDAQLQLMSDFFNLKKNKNLTKIIFLHHNMIQPELHKVLINLEEVLRCLANCGVKLILAGHLHDAFIEKIVRPYIDYNMYIITAGTAISNRLRSQVQSFNLIEINPEYFTTDIYYFNNTEFIPGAHHQLAL